MCHYRSYTLRLLGQLSGSTYQITYLRTRKMVCAPSWHLWSHYNCNSHFIICVIFIVGVTICYDPGANLDVGCRCIIVVEMYLILVLIVYHEREAIKRVFQF